MHRHLNQIQTCIWLPLEDKNETVKTEKLWNLVKYYY